MSYTTCFCHESRSNFVGTFENGHVDVCADLIAGMLSLSVAASSSGGGGHSIDDRPVEV